DLKFGEMHKADFAISNCSSAIAKEISLRKTKMNGSQEELARALKEQFNAQDVQKDITQIKGLSASGFVGSPAASPGQISQPAPGEIAPATPSAAAKPAIAPAGAAKPAETTASSSTEFNALNNELGFVDLHNQDVLPFTQANVRVKGA